MKRKLVLQDGTCFSGDGFGSLDTIVAEVVFNTAMSGYQETISDLSYSDQIITFTYPLIGNYGINEEDFESLNPSTKAVIVHEFCDKPSNFRCKYTLEDLLKKHNIVGLSDIDTRALTKKLRQSGVTRGIICDETLSIEQAIALIQSTPVEENVIQKNVKERIEVYPGSGHRVVVVNFGIKNNIIEELKNRNCYVIVVPYTLSAEEILSYRPDGVVLSNGPGDPKAMSEVLPELRKLQGKVVLFGICMGHQLIGLANGADTFKLKYGHRGANHPVKELKSGKVYITSQNHGYAIDPQSIMNTDLEVSHIAINDGSIEGLVHKYLPTFSIQYHPEAAPGPQDARVVFDRFIKEMRGE